MLLTNKRTIARARVYVFLLCCTGVKSYMFVETVLVQELVSIFSGC